MKYILQAIFILSSLLSASSLKEMNENINGTNDLILKQLYICEREVIYNKESANPNDCIKSAKQHLSLAKPSKEMAGMITYEYYNPKDPSSYAVPGSQIFEIALEKYKNKYAAEAYFNAGIIYQFGVKYHDINKAAEMYKLGAKLGNRTAQLNLGFSYYLGKGIEKNKISAYKWWLKSAKKGSEKAQNMLDILCQESPWACK